MQQLFWGQTTTLGGRRLRGRSEGGLGPGVGATGRMRWLVARGRRNRQLVSQERSLPWGPPGTKGPQRVSAGGLTKDDCALLTVSGCRSSPLCSSSSSVLSASLKDSSSGPTRMQTKSRRSPNPGTPDYLPPPFKSRSRPSKPFPIQPPPTPALPSSRTTAPFPTTSPPASDPTSHFLPPPVNPSYGSRSHHTKRFV